MSKELFNTSIIPRSTLDQIFEEGNVVLRPRIIGGTAENMSFVSASSGARVEIFPDNDQAIGVVVYDDAENIVFKTVVSGTDVGDVIIGDYDGGQGIKYDKSAGTITYSGVSVEWADVADGASTKPDDNATEGATAGTDLKESGGSTASQLAGLFTDLGSITAGDITLDSSGFIKGGQTSYENGTGFFLGYSGSAYKFSIGDGISYLKWDGTYLKISGSKIEKQFIGNWKDGLTEVTANCAIDRNPIGTRIHQDTAAGGHWKFHTSGGIGIKNLDGDGITFADYHLFRCLWACKTGLADSGAFWGTSFFWGLLHDDTIKQAIGTNGTDFNTTQHRRHAGFFVARDTKLYASCGNGTGRTMTEITGITVTNNNDYIIKRGASNVQFYVNNVLKATISSNMPESELAEISFQGCCGRNVSHSMDAYIGNNYEDTVT